MFTRSFLALTTLALLGCLAAATEPSSVDSLRKKKKGGGKKGSDDAAMVLHADIEIKGLEKDPTPSDITWLDYIIKLVLNEHEDGSSGWLVVNVVDEEMWVKPEAYALFLLDDSSSPAAGDHDSSSLTGPMRRRYTASIFAKIRYACHLCRSDDDSPFALRQQLELTDGRSPNKVSPADEKQVCELLRNSGVENFADIHDCSVKLVPKLAGAESAYLDMAITTAE
jgi:hypothetical protein